MIRARTIAAREAGISETSESLLTLGRDSGLTLGGWTISSAMMRALESAEPALGAGHSEITQTMLGSSGLWLRAEPDEDAGQADALAAIIVDSITGATA
jgi:hypothetical protein